MCRFYTDGRILYIPSDQLGIIVTLSMRVHLVEEKETGTTDILFLQESTDFASLTSINHMTVENLELFHTK